MENKGGDKNGALEDKQLALQSIYANKSTVNRNLNISNINLHSESMLKSLILIKVLGLPWWRSG